jgi:hypothetical protein
MKIQKETWLVVAVAGFLLSWFVDNLGGPVRIAITNPTAFLTSGTLLSEYPFTATAIIVRALTLFVTVMLVFSFLEGKYFLKAAVLLFVGILAEFFAIQQLSTGFRVTTIQWTLSIAYASPLLVFGILGMILKGIWAVFNKKEAAKGPTEGQDSSVLEPPPTE